MSSLNFVNTKLGYFTYLEDCKFTQPTFRGIGNHPHEVYQSLPIVAKFQPDISVSKCSLYGIYQITNIYDTNQPNMTGDIPKASGVTHGNPLKHIQNQTTCFLLTALSSRFSRRLFEEDQDQFQRCDITTWEICVNWSWGRHTLMKFN